MAEQAKFVIIKHDGKQIGISDDLDLKKLQTTLSGQTNVVVRVGNFILAKGMIHAIVRAESTIETGNNIHMIVARCNIYVNAIDVSTTLDKIETETNSKDFVLIDDSVLFFRMALEVAQPL